MLMFIYMHDNYPLQNKACSITPLILSLPPTLCRTTSSLASLAMMIHFLSCQSTSSQRSENKCYKAYELFRGFLINSTCQVFTLLREIIRVLPPQLKQPSLYQIIEKRKHNLEVKGINCTDGEQYDMNS